MQHAALVFATPTTQQATWAYTMLTAKPFNRATLRRVLRAYRMACLDSKTARSPQNRVAAANMARSLYAQAYVLLQVGARRTK